MVFFCGCIDWSPAAVEEALTVFLEKRKKSAFASCKEVKGENVISLHAIMGREVTNGAFP